MSKEKVKSLRQISNLLDNAFKIPGTSFGIGLDPLIGLVPGGGDLLTGIFSAYLVFKAAEFGLPKATLIKMTTHILIDIFAGTIPLIGDFFDLTWKANTKNMDLLESHLESPLVYEKADQWFVWLLLLIILTILIIVTALGVGLILLFLRLFNG